MHGVDRQFLSTEFVLARFCFYTSCHFARQHSFRYAMISKRPISSTSAIDFGLSDGSQKAHDVPQPLPQIQLRRLVTITEATVEKYCLRWHAAGGDLQEVADLN
jgi:hypothetical protein